MTWDQLRVAGLIVVALGILVLTMYKIGQAANLFSKRYELLVYLPSANGLRQGGSVTLAGQLVGTVKQIDFLPVDDRTNLDSIYVRDASVVCARGVILCRMGKRLRAGEPAAHLTILVICR